MKCFDGIANFYNTHKFPITLEPVVFFWSFPAGMNQVVRTSLVVEKICRNKLNYTEVICGNLSAYEDIQDDVQRSVTAYEADMQMLAFVPRILYAIFAGTWSDRNGRKPLLFLPVFCQLLQCLSFILNYVFMVELDWRFMYLELVMELGGNFVLYYLINYSYLVDVTTVAERTLRIAVVDGFDFGALAVGNALSGPIFTSLGSEAAFAISSASNLISLTWIIFFLKESVTKTKNPAKNGTSNVLKTSLLYTFEGFRTILKPREGYRRLFVLLGVFNYTCYLSGFVGTEGSQRLLFLKKKYNWSEENMASFLFVNKCEFWFGLWVLLPIIKKVIKLSDIPIAILALASTALGYCLPAFTDSSAWLTVGDFILNWFSFCSFLTVMCQCYQIINRSVMSQAVESDEIGRIFSILAIFSAITGSIVGAAFQMIYNKTLDTFPGAYLLGTSGLALAAIPTNMIMYKLLKTFKKTEAIEMENKIEESRL